MQILESKLESNCRKLAIEAGCKFLKIQGTKGWPDRLVVAPNGRVAFVEFKSATGRVAPLQEHIIQELIWMKHMAVVVRLEWEFKVILRDLQLPSGSLTTTKYGG